MPSTGIIYPEQVANLRRVFDEFCAEHRITDAAARSEIADLLVSLHRADVEHPDELREALREAATAHHYAT